MGGDGEFSYIPVCNNIQKKSLNFFSKTKLSGRYHICVKVSSGNPQYGNVDSILFKSVSALRWGHLKRDEYLHKNI